MKKRTLFWMLITGCVTVVAWAQTSRSHPPEKSSADTPLVKILRQCVDSMQPVNEQTKVLIAKQKQQLTQVSKVSIQSEGGEKSGLGDFFATGDELRKAFSAKSNRGISTAEYSPDPAQCSNHCYQTCGYNSVGDKVCWYVCYRCCSNGGC